MCLYIEWPLFICRDINASLVVSCVLTPQVVLRLPTREVLVSWDPLIA